MNGLTAGLAQCLCQRGRKLRVDQNEQNLFRRDNGMVRLAGGKGQNCIDVCVLKIGIFLKNGLSRLAGRHQAKNVRDRNAQAANTWTAMHAIGIDRYSFKKVRQWQYHRLSIAPSAAFVSKRSPDQPMGRRGAPPDDRLRYPGFSFCGPASRHRARIRATRATVAIVDRAIIAASGYCRNITCDWDGRNDAN